MGEGWCYIINRVERWRHSSANVEDGRIMLIGGRDGNCTSRREIYMTGEITGEIPYAGVRCLLLRLWVLEKCLHVGNSLRVTN